MRAVIQRVSRDEVRVEGSVIGKIDRGLLVLAGFHVNDTQENCDKIAGKIARIRLFPDEEGKMNRNVTEIGGGILSISQFTLIADCRKGNRPSFIEAARPELARVLYDRFCERLSEESGQPVERGSFGADMQVDLVNDGPVTIILES